MRFNVLEVTACVLAHVSMIWGAPRASREVGSGLSRGKSLGQRQGDKHTIVKHNATGSEFDFVTNSGICETTPRVNQYSGYFSVGSNISYFFWFFEARHSPEHAPLVAWFNGGPGCSSMMGLLQANGPCQFYNGSSTPSLNPYSWNEYANMLYIDQPAGVGFSFQSDQTNSSITCDDKGYCQPSGVINATVEVNSTVAAASFVWKFVQAFFAQFPQYENHDFGIFTESYGGHYGPGFAHYFEQQNEEIERGTIVGQKVNLVALGINNGWYDATIQERQGVEFYYKNSYYPLINESIYESMVEGFNGLCLPALKNCTSAAGSTLDDACMESNMMCNKGVDDLALDSIDSSIFAYDIRQRSKDSTKFTPPATFTTWLSDPAVMEAIGAKGSFTLCSDRVGEQFISTGDNARSLLPELSEVVKSGVNTLVWAGDADMVCDWMGNLAVADAVAYPDIHVFKHKEVKNYTVNGVVAGTYKTEGQLNWLRVFESGHSVSYYQPELALQVFKQVMEGRPIHST